MATANRGGRFFHNTGLEIANAPQPQDQETALPLGGMIRVPHKSRYTGTRGNGIIYHSEVGNSFNKVNNGDSMRPLAQNYLIGGKTYSNQKF